MGLYPIDLGTGPHGEPWELDLRNNGSGWTGTFASLIQRATQEIIENGQDNNREWFVEVTLADGNVYAGTIGEWRGGSSDDVIGGGTFTVTTDDWHPMIIEPDEVVRFRA